MQSNEENINDVAAEQPDKNACVDAAQDNENVENKATATQCEATATHDEESASLDDKEQTEKESGADNEIEKLTAKIAESEERYRRMYAEFENYRKRTSIEKADLILSGGKDVIKSVLPVVDDLERAMTTIADEATKEGVELIYNKLIGVLQQKGLKAMDAKGKKFDDSIHEAVTRIPATDEEQKGLVFDEVEKGYYLNDKVLRYAKVVVAI